MSFSHNCLSYALDNETNQVTILEENNYYPFGLKHGGYNTTKKEIKYNAQLAGSIEIQEVVPEAVKFKYYYQEQERQDELGLNWDSFKYRNYDYAIGRFMSVDPLAEKYAYNSTYAFQENKMGLGRELEGLELDPFRKTIYTTDQYLYRITRNSNTLVVNRTQKIYGPTLQSDNKTISLTLGSNVKQKYVTTYSSVVIADNMMATNNYTATITSGYRDPKNQARVMFYNIKMKGVASQKKLYGKFGDMVINKYVSAIKYNNTASKVNSLLNFNLLPKLSNDNVKHLMTNTIYQVGPSKVSKHSSDPTKYNVIDLSPRSIQNISSLISNFKNDLRIRKVIVPRYDPGLHIEIPQ